MKMNFQYFLELNQEMARQELNQKLLCCVDLNLELLSMQGKEHYGRDEILRIKEVV